MEELMIKSPIVSVDWLYKHLTASNLVVLDASMKKATETESDLATVQIPNARFFDIKNTFSNVKDPFPNAVPSKEQFNNQAQQLGINNDSAIVVYDDKGIYSSARAWWLFKAFGHNNIAVLDGGLPEWMAKDYPLESKQIHQVPKGNFQGTYHYAYFKFFDDIVSIKESPEYLIMDARSENRFKSLVKEPREGLRSGHIPNSVNLPYARLLQENKLKNPSELRAIFNTFDIKDKTLVFSCGSGITACILALAAELTNNNQVSVYDGSWTEYGSLTSE